MTDLHLAVCGEYFDAMVRGEKEEYRQVNAWWTKRLSGREFERLIITRGYPARNDTSRRLVLPWRGYSIKTITHKHFGVDPIQVYAIKLE